MKRKDFDFGKAMSGFLNSMYSYWDSVRDARLAIDAFARCNGWERCADSAVESDPVGCEGRVNLEYRNKDRDCKVYLLFAWYTMQSGRKEITVYVAT